MTDESQWNFAEEIGSSAVNIVGRSMTLASRKTTTEASGLPGAVHPQVVGNGARRSRRFRPRQATLWNGSADLPGCIEAA
ncbi:MAG: hypothetical protein L0Z50_05235 [Verrucomicrobiales bacterium]|nr:hypothetical protein [Verrucomicrobiales bacterium]